MMPGRLTFFYSWAIFRRRHAVVTERRPSRLARSVNDANKFRNSFFSASGLSLSFSLSPSPISDVEMKQTHAAFLPVHSVVRRTPLPPSLPPSLSRSTHKRGKNPRRREIPLFLCSSVYVS